jgi:hypothetical protein
MEINKNSTPIDNSIVPGVSEIFENDVPSVEEMDWLNCIGCWAVGEPVSKRVPHLKQNLASTGFSEPQLEHFIVARSDLYAIVPSMVFSNARGEPL